MGRVAVRPPGRLLPLLLLLALLSGCAGGGAASASEDEEPQAPLLMEHGCLSMDLDGDGAEEAVRLYALQAADDLPPEALPPEGSDSRNLLFRWYVEAQIGDDLVTCDLNGRYYYYSPQQDQPLFFSIQDRQGASLVVAGLIPQSNGAGAGMLEVHVLSCDKGACPVLELPLWSIQSVQAGMTAQITVPETGTVETLDLLQWLELRGEGPLYEADGTLAWPCAPASWEEGDIYALLPAEEGIWTAQRLYGQALSDLMGYLVTHLTWDDGTPVVLEQYFDWRAQNDDEVLR